MNTERLNHLKTILVNLNLNENIEFNLGIWIKTTSCKTVACALGYAALDPIFNEQGLVLVEQKCKEYISIYPEQSTATIRYKDFTYLNAAQEFFDLTQGEAEYIFIGCNYEKLIEIITPQHVIEHIDRVLNYNNCISEILEPVVDMVAA